MYTPPAPYDHVKIARHKSALYAYFYFLLNIPMSYIGMSPGSLWDHVEERLQDQIMGRSRDVRRTFAKWVLKAQTY